MADDEQKKHGALWPAVMGFALLVGYPLSIGPVCWLAENGYLDRLPPWTHTALTWFYAPLGWLCWMIPPLERLMGQYYELWAP